MDCPHCGEENLVGARLCVACGGSTTAQAPPPVARAAHAMAGAASTARPQAAVAVGAAPVSARGAPPMSALCRVCLDGFDIDLEAPGAVICPRCRGADGSAAVDVPTAAPTILPGTQDRLGPDPRATVALPRMKAVARRTSLRSGVRIALWVVGLGVAALAVWMGRHEKDPLAEHLAGVKLEPAELDVSPPREGVTRLEATSNFGLARELVRGSFSTSLDELLRLDQRAVQSIDVAWVRDDEKGTVIDVASSCRVARQTGIAPGADGREVKAYPWEGHQGTERLVVPIQDPVQVLGGGAPVVGRDVPPFLTLRDVGAPRGAVAPGASWKTSLVLPLFASREGGLVAASFPCDVTYLGRRLQSGVPCYVLSLKGAVPREIPSALPDMNRTGGTLRAALFFDVATGLLVEAHAVADVAAWIDRGRIEERVRLSGTIDVKRR